MAHADTGVRAEACEITQALHGSVIGAIRRIAEELLGQSGDAISSPERFSQSIEWRQVLDKLGEGHDRSEIESALAQSTPHDATPPCSALPGWRSSRYGQRSVCVTAFRVETIAATIGAYARGEIDLEPIDEKARGAGGGIYRLNIADAKLKAYTVNTVARFLG